MRNVRASELRKFFPKWSQGTLYNRLETLDIRDNDKYVVKMENTATILYNVEAIELLKEQYLKEFTNNTQKDKEQLDNYVLRFLSSKDASKVLFENEPQKNGKNDKKDDNIEESEKVEKKDNVNVINEAYLKENYIPKELHKEIVDGLKKQIDTLEKQLEKETANNEKLVDTIKLREQKEAVIEQQNLVKLQQQQENREIKALDTEEGNRKNWFMRLFSKKK